MEKEMNDRGRKDYETRKDDLNVSSKSSLPVDNQEPIKEQEIANKRKRIRAYQRIDYWQ
jgi:hypothetical protein